MKKKILKWLIVAIILTPIILIVGFTGYLHICKQMQYHENKKVVYDYLQEKFGKEFELIRVEKEDFDFWTSREDDFYFKDIEEDFVFTVTAAHGDIDDDSYSQMKFGKEVEKEFYKALPENINYDFIFTARAYDYEREYTHAVKAIYGVLYILDEDMSHEKNHKLVSHIFNQFSDEWDVDISLQICNKEAKKSIEKLIRSETDYDDVSSKIIFTSRVCERDLINNNYDYNNLEDFIDIVNQNTLIYE